MMIYNGRTAAVEVVQYCGNNLRMEYDSMCIIARLAFRDANEPRELFLHAGGDVADVIADHCGGREDCLDETVFVWGQKQNTCDCWCSEFASLQDAEEYHADVVSALN